MLDINKLSFQKEVILKDWAIVINCGEDIILSDETTLKSFDSGLFRNSTIKGNKLLTFKIGKHLEVSDEQIDFCRKNWIPVFDIFPLDIFKDKDFFRSPKIKLGELEFNFWYCGENFSCGVHNEHNFFELHTQILGQGEMQKFHSEKENSIFFQELLSPGQTHSPFFTKDMKYPYHQYKSNTKCIWLAIESAKIIP